MSSTYVYLNRAQIPALFRAAHIFQYFANMSHGWHSFPTVNTHNLPFANEMNRSKTTKSNCGKSSQRNSYKSPDTPENLERKTQKNESSKGKAEHVLAQKRKSTHANGKSESSSWQLQARWLRIDFKKCLAICVHNKKLTIFFNRWQKMAFTLTQCIKLN